MAATPHALLNEAGTVVLEVVDRDLATLPPAKAARYRPLVVDAVPVLQAGQIAEPGALVIEAARVRQPWVVRALTAAEIEAAAVRDELATLQARIDEIQAQRQITREQWDGYTANQLRSEQWRDRQTLLRAVHVLLRSARRGL